ncbi:hypothetical protein AURDEDRAFT_166263 [Auricularia subglabra TFB-10046 SS5]|nr:hypothetical protein AURDEDRAFT_166263 [Auricularia subglabra TFB-10046 SS5]
MMDYHGPDVKQLDLSRLSEALTQLSVDSPNVPDAVMNASSPLPPGFNKEVVAQLRIAAQHPDGKVIREAFGYDKDGRNARDRPDPQVMTDEQRAGRTMKNHRRDNRTLLARALEPDNIIRVSELSIKSLLKEDQTRNWRKHPQYPNITRIPASKGPFCVVDADDVPVVFVFPQCLQGPAHVSQSLT